MSAEATSGGETREASEVNWGRAERVEENGGKDEARNELGNLGVGASEGELEGYPERVFQQRSSARALQHALFSTRSSARVLQLALFSTRYSERLGRG